MILIYFVVFMKFIQAIFQIGKLLSLHQRNASANALVALASRNVKGDSRNAIVNHFLQQFSARKTRI
jgi:hypothetical protein